MAQRRSWNSDRIRPADAAIGPLRPPRVTVWAGLRHGWIGSGRATEDVAVEAVVGQGLGIPEPHAVLGAHRLGRRGEVGDRTRPIRSLRAVAPEPISIGSFLRKA